NLDNKYKGYGNFGFSATTHNLRYLYRRHKNVQIQAIFAGFQALFLGSLNVPVANLVTGCRLVGGVQIWPVVTRGVNQGWSSTDVNSPGGWNLGHKWTCFLISQSYRLPKFNS